MKEQNEGLKLVSKESLSLIVKQTNTFRLVNMLLFSGNQDRRTIETTKRLLNPNLLLLTLRCLWR